MKIKKYNDSVRNFIDRFEPITSKILHDNIFAIAGQSAFFLINPLKMSWLTADDAARS